jgi:nitrogen fixation NifU-like protein
VEERVLVSRDESILRNILEEHALNPFGQGSITKPTHTAEWISPKTGNICRVQIRIENDRLVDLVANVQGSALAKACASIMCATIQGGNLRATRSTLSEIKEWVETRKSPEEWVGDLKVYQSIVQFPERVDCAMLCWMALSEALTE